MLFTILQSMIVPEFKLKQNDRFVEVFIRVPYIKVSACEFYIDGRSFKFYLKPYLLSLSFQQNLKDVEEPAKAVYYHEKYILQVHLEKAVAGELFKKLDIISSLLNNKKEKKIKRTLVEVVSQNSTISQLSQENGVVNQYHYGFGLNYSNVFDNLQQQAAQIFSFNPKSTPLCERFALSKQIISKQFDIDSYFYDKYQNQQQIAYILKDPSPSQYIHSIAQKYKGVQINHETYKLKHRIPKKDILLTASVRQNISKQIVSILFSYIYELVCMNGELGPESAKTINKTSIVLNCNYNYSNQSLSQMLIDCYQRCFTYSLYRTQAIAQNAKSILENTMDRQTIIAVFEDMYRLFESSEPRYLLNRIYLEDYLIYLYSLKNSEAIEETILQVRKVKITQGQLNMQKLNQEGQIRLLLESQLPIKQNMRSEEQKKKLVQEMEKMNLLD